MLNSRTDRANGVLAIYLDDWEMFWRDDIVFRVNDTVKFSLFTFSTSVFLCLHTYLFFFLSFHLFSWRAANADR